MLLCHDCHKIIDSDKKGERYSAKLLGQWKDEHEKRIAIVTGVDLGKKSHVILYGANIGEEESKLQPNHAKGSLFPDWYPADERPVCLSMVWKGSILIFGSRQNLKVTISLLQAGSKRISIMNSL
jgi:hypothetical protein